MSLKYLLGSAFSRSIDAILSSRWFPLTRRFPYGVSWVFDVQRLLRTRSLGVVFDVGANVGQTLTALLRYAPAAEIYCFEPGLIPFRALQAKFKDRKNAHLSNVALGSHPETLTLQVSENSELSTLMFRGKADPSNTTQLTEVTTVDIVAAAHEISHLDVLKIDAQGWEMEVLKGAKNLIEDQNLIFVFAEVTFRSDETEMQQFGELHSHLEKSGFVLCGLYDLLRYGPRKEFILFANVLYMHPEARLKWANVRTEWAGWLSRQKPKLDPAA
ncbi:MAG: FkbM family methyltransferase [Reyranella sp.]|nr:FkbM family methyltransferase [Reyranella sp.]